jgi:hypothetical protein
MKRLQEVVCRALASNSSMSYERTMLAIEKMVNMVSHTEEPMWDNEEFGISLDSLIVGAYWFCSDYHGGQWSPEYRALSALGKVFKPGPLAASSSLEGGEEIVYEALQALQGRCA